ncbi:hypothetical protein [Agromyces larvae]|uniref:DUF2336 domain-containing protein n=1 Tax=Agromyces larvae TaxID=2929802 RepID=A0ABY4BYW0_9MICO|nr:hypothetical protein [Agromyces larvae]UOE43382.1 hypothetical protein MTO99_14485 [Agromyces larvae]
MTPDLRVAFDPTTAGRLLEPLASHPDQAVREAVASNPNCPARVLLGLAQDDEVSVRLKVAANSDTPPGLLRALATDSDESVRSAALANPSCLAELLWEQAEALVGRDGAGQLMDSDEICAATEQAYREYEEWARDNEEEDWIEDEDKDDWIEDEHEDESDLIVVDVTWIEADRITASRSSTPSVVLDGLSIRRHPSVRSAVAGNRNSSPETLKRLAADSDSGVRMKAATNPSTPLDTRHGLATDQDERVRAALARDPRTPVSLLARLALDMAPAVQQMVAVNPNTARSDVEKLTHSSEPNVRRAALSERRRRLHPLRRSRATHAGRAGVLRLNGDELVFESNNDHIRLWLGKIVSLQTRRTGFFRGSLLVRTSYRHHVFVVQSPNRWQRAIERIRPHR